jgi:guanylate kinase
VSTSWERPQAGALFVVSGASGSGKTTLLKRVFARVPGLQFSVSATTRAIRAGEAEGVDYHFVDIPTFQRLRDAGDLLEHAEVYGRHYGTPREPVEQALGQGLSVVLDIDVQGARQVRRSHPSAVSIFILPPSVGTIKERLVARGTDSAEVIARRVREAEEQLSACEEYDYLVMNDELETATQVLESVVLAELSRTSRRARWVKLFT